MTNLTNKVKTDLRNFIDAALPYLKADALEYGECCLTVACSNEGDRWSFQTGDNSFTGGAYCFPIWAVVYVDEGTKAEDLYNEVIGQLEDFLS